MKKIFYTLRLLALIGLTNANESAPQLWNNAQTHETKTNKIIGGWSPVFFTKYDESQVNSIDG